MLCIKKPSVASAFDELIPKILKEGELVETEFGERTKEIKNTIIEITNPKLKRVPEKYPLGEKAVEEYTKNLLYGSKNVFSYDYHERLFKYPYGDERINQIEYIINKLNQQKNSRRAVAITWNPKIDIEVSKDERGSVPCLQFIEFLIRGDNLYMTVVFRSNDALIAFPSNAIRAEGMFSFIRSRYPAKKSLAADIANTGHSTWRRTLVNSWSQIARNAWSLPSIALKAPMNSKWTRSRSNEGNRLLMIFHVSTRYLPSSSGLAAGSIFLANSSRSFSVR